MDAIDAYARGPAVGDHVKGGDAVRDGFQEHADAASADLVVGDRRAMRRGDRGMAGGIVAIHVDRIVVAVVDPVADNLDAVELRALDADEAGPLDQVVGDAQVARYGLDRSLQHDALADGIVNGQILHRHVDAAALPAQQHSGTAKPVAELSLALATAIDREAAKHGTADLALAGNDPRIAARAQLRIGELQDAPCAIGPFERHAGAQRQGAAAIAVVGGTIA